jgi:hypothetical protein
MIPTILQIIRRDRDDGSRPRWDVYLAGRRAVRSITSPQLINLGQFRTAAAKRGLRFSVRLTRENRNQWHGAVATALRGVR